MSRTKKFKTAWIILSIISFLLTFGPLLYFVLDAFLKTGVIHNKIALSCTLMVVIMITMLCILREHRPRSLPLIVLIALWCALDSLGGIIITFTITQCLDEFIIDPIKKFCYRRLIINKEIDKR